jgi:uncharacterized protein (TIGR03067 family)
MNSALIGLWMVMTAQLGGQDITLSLTMLSLQINGEEYSVSVKGQVVDAGRLEFKGGYDLDIIGVSGTNQGKTLKCIYKMDGDNVVICYNMDTGGERPTDFVSPAGTKMLLVTYQKKQ